MQGSIYLGPTTNFHISYKFTSLRTGSRTTRKKITSLTMQQSIIKQVEDMAIKENHDADLIFTNRNRSNLELFNDDANTHDVTVGVENNYNNYNSNNSA